MSAGSEAPEERDGGVAIVGMSGRFPGCRTLHEFWTNLCAGQESISSFSEQELLDSGVGPDLIRDPHYVSASGVLAEPDLFDASFFGYSPKEAQFMDPQQRLFLECAWEALEHAGYDVERMNRSVGVYAGCSMNTYMLFSGVLSKLETDFLPVLFGSDKDYLTTRVSYKLNLRGPSVTVQTACSTSLVAVHLACQSLLNRECDMALAGGVSLRVPLKAGYVYRDGSIYSPDGHCRPFDAAARGTVFGSGVGVIALKRLADAVADRDWIHAVIKGSAINNDGSSKVAYTAPSLDRQADVILHALENAGVDATTVSYLEAHGTGTPLGDPIEVSALTKAFRNHTDRTGFCAIGSVKSNIGHLDVASGIAGLIKTVLALQHRTIPPSINFDKPNPAIEFGSSPFYVNSALSAWESDGWPRRAGVTSLGVGGTNAHVIVEEAPAASTATQADADGFQLVTLSARSPESLKAATRNLVQHLTQHPELKLADVAYTLQTGRKAFKHRRTVVCETSADLAVRLETLDPKWVKTAAHASSTRDVVFLFSGQGSQYVNMGRDLYSANREFRSHLDRCSEILRGHLGFDLRDVLYPSTEADVPEAEARLTQTSVAQPALFAIEWALAHCWASWGIRPTAMVGHSVGEYVAACLAGVFSLEDALSLIARRGRLMQQLPEGSMLAVPLSEQDIRPWLSDAVSIAAVNGPSLCVASGTHADIEDLAQHLAAADVECRPLHTSHAFHSAMMDPILEAFQEEVARIPLNPPTIPYVSNVTGDWITPAQATAPAYWAQHLRQTVRFADCLGVALSDPGRLLMEVGPGSTLSALARQHPARSTDHVIVASIRHPKDTRSDVAFMLSTAGELWLAGMPLDWASLPGKGLGRRCPLPTYPFERMRFWLDAAQPVARQAAREESQSAEPVAGARARPSTDEAESGSAGAPRDDVERSLAEMWRNALGARGIGIQDNFFELGGTSLSASGLFADIAKVFGRKLPLATLYQAPTIGQLANLLRGGAPTQAWGSLVPIQSGGAKAPFFCVHAEGGNVVGYRDLAEHVGGDFPFYGLQAQGLDGSVPGSTKFEDMAAHYLTEVRRVQPHGPYYLGGWCLGADIAFEMAQQLALQNEQVGLLVMIQSRRPSCYASRQGPPALVRAAQRVSDRVDYEVSRLVGRKGLKETIPHLTQRIGRALTIVQFACESRLHSTLVRFGLERLHSQTYTLEALAAAHNTGYETYKPRSFDGPIVIVRTEKQPSGIVPDPTLGWGAFIRGDAQLYEVPGYHQTVLEPPYVQVLAAHLRQCIEEARRRDASAGGSGDAVKALRLAV